jgi:formate/nitrite transporter FocA (FNT family)
MNQDLEPADDAAAGQKSYRQILAGEIASGLREHERPSHGLLISGFSAGLDVSFSLFLMAVALTLTEGSLARPAVELLTAAFYSVGFIFVVIGRSELFTEHTTLAVLPVLNRRTTVPSLLRLWALVYLGNIAGAALFAYFVVLIGPALGVTERNAFGTIASQLVNHGDLTLIGSAMFAGWLMGLMSWLVMAASDTIGRIFIISLIAFCIGFAKLPHAVLGTTEVLSGVFAGVGADLADFGRFLGFTTLGNALGGVIFVAVIKYSHIIRSRPD